MLKLLLGCDEVRAGRSERYLLSTHYILFIHYIDYIYYAIYLFNVSFELSVKSSNAELISGR